jgi:hypothetical protein
MTRDVVRFIYAGNAAAWSRDLRNLEKQGLIERRIPDGSRARQPEVLTLTPAARTLLNAARPIGDGPPQRFYSGIIKPRELAHDAAIYRMVEYERARLDSQGARITRVVLDTELKASVYRAWDAASQGARDADTKRDVAEAHGLPIVHGHIQFPDARLEIEHPDGGRGEVDLELATRHYNRAHLQAKAGFRMYVPHGDDLIARITDV